MRNVAFGSHKKREAALPAAERGLGAVHNA